MTARNGRPNKPAGLAWYDALRCDPIFGVSAEVLERFQAPSRKAADDYARDKHGTSVLVTLATNVKRIERRRRAKDLGNTNRRNTMTTLTTIGTPDRVPNVIPLIGHLIHSNRRQFKIRVLDALAEGDKRIVLDCTETQYIDSAGLGVLVSLQRAAYLHHAQIVLANLNPDMRSLLETTKLSDMIPVAETVGQAIAKMRGGET